MANLTGKKSPRLHEILTTDEITELYDIFKNAPEEKFSRAELKQAFAKFRIILDKDDFETLFLKMNTNRDDRVDWDEFISHLLLGFQADDPYNQKATLNLPIEKAPVVRRSLHNFPIIRIRFCPTVLPDRSINNITGNFITASKDGTLIWWNQNFEYQRTGKSKNISLRVAKTWILDFIVLPDVRVICTSSIECDLRFYDMSASNFQLRIVISNLPHEIYSMHYWYATNANANDEHCKIVLGDAVGNVTMLEFHPELRGPFQSKTGTALTQLTWREFLQGKLPLMKITFQMKIHKDIVRQVEYSEFLNSIISAAECRDVPMGKKPNPGLVISELGVQKNQTFINMYKGVTCFAFDPISQMFATGGPDCILRLWNHIVPQKPIAILPGHHSGIIYLFIQDGGEKIYTIDMNKTIKIWDAIEQNLQQTYIQLITTMPDKSATTCFYHDTNRELILASLRIVAINCLPLLNLDKIDGYTHSKQVSVILYNDLFKSIVTCGLDSYIIVWDPWTAKRMTLIKNAHTRLFHGEIKRVEITAGCFDPKKQLLLSGARDGTLKIWNFNNGICMRNLSIEHMCEVTAVFWLHERILAMGWNKHVIEFGETGDSEHGSGKYWDICHREDILCAGVRDPQTLATASYAGELVLWKLEPGQPYRRYSVENPTSRIKIVYEGQKSSVLTEPKYKRSRASNLTFLTKSYMQPATDIDAATAKTKEFDNDDVRRISIIQLPSHSAIHQYTAVQSMVFLNTRPMRPDYGTLCLAIDYGFVQMYSHHDLGGFIDTFNGIHLAGDCIVACTTDLKNRFLFTGTIFGYVKICVPKSNIVHVNMPELRIEFPFLWRDRWEGRAKRTVRHQTVPLLCSSYKAHIQPITGIIYIDEAKLVVTSSSDFTVRIWTLSGQYIGTLGSPIKWNIHLTPNGVQLNDFNFRIPPDIQRVASSTTLKVLKGGDVTDPLAYLIARSKRPRVPEENDNVADKNSKIYGVAITEPILGNHLRLPNVEPIQTNPVLDKSLEYHPVYSHLKYDPADLVQTPLIPDLLTKWENFDVMDNQDKK